jgi:hypothetical protein
VNGKMTNETPFGAPLPTFGIVDFGIAAQGTAGQTLDEGAWFDDIVIHHAPIGCTN